MNIRFSLKKMRSRGLISREFEIRIASSLKELHFSKRSLPAVRSVFEHEFGELGATTSAFYESTKVGIKILDAELMLSVGPRVTISLKRSTQNLQLSTRSPADYPIFWH